MILWTLYYMLCVKLFLSIRYLHLTLAIEFFCLPGLFILDAALLYGLNKYKKYLKRTTIHSKLAFTVTCVCFVFLISILAVWIGLLFAHCSYALITGTVISWKDLFEVWSTVMQDKTLNSDMAKATPIKSVLLNVIFLLGSLFLAILVYVLKSRVERKDYVKVDDGTNQKRKYSVKSVFLFGLLFIYAAFCIFYPVDDRFWNVLKFPLIFGGFIEAAFPSTFSTSLAPSDKWIEKCPHMNDVLDCIYKNDFTLCDKYSQEKERLDEALVKAELHKPTVKNVIFLFLETTRGDSFPFDYNSKLAKEHLNCSTMVDKNITPFTKELAEKGLFLRNNIKAVSSFSCKSIFSTLCGIYPFPASGFPEIHHKPYTACLPGVLKELGFHTQHSQFVKEIFSDVTGYKLRMKYGEVFSFDDYVNRPGTRIYRGGIPASAEDLSLADLIAEVLEKHKETPVFLSLTTSATHHPFVLPDGQKRQSFSNTSDVDEYLNTISYQDKVVESIVKNLQQSGEMKNTLLVMMGDHGTHFYDNNNFVSTVNLNPHDSNFSVSSILYSENEIIMKMLAEMKEKNFLRLSSIDLAPTLIDLIFNSHTKPENVNFHRLGYEGVSLLRSFDDSKRISISVANPGLSSISARTLDYKYILFSTGYEEFYILQSDPYEKHVIKKGNLSSHGPEVNDWFYRLRKAAHLWYIKVGSLYKKDPIV